jgi:cell division septation protein DedD
MPTNPAQIDPEKLRAFERRLSQEGAAGFAAGPTPWESWDESGSAGTWQVEHDTPRAAPRRRPRKPAGQRLLTGIARLSVVALVVGIAGVYFTSVREPQLAVNGIQPAPVAATAKPATGIPSLAGVDARQGSVTIDLNILPAPAAGRPEIAVVAVTADRQEQLPAAQETAGVEDAPANTSAHDMTMNSVPETSVATPAQQAGTAEQQTALQRPDATPAANSRPIPQQSETTSAPAPQAGTGTWVVNLASCQRESTARRMLEEFRDKGVTAEMIQVTVNERPMIRVRTSGYDSFQETSDWAALLGERLQLDGVWVSKR